VKGHATICLMEDFLVKIITTEQIKLHFCTTIHKALTNIRDLSWTSSVQHLLGCNGSHSTTVPVHSPHEFWVVSRIMDYIFNVWGLLGGHYWQRPMEGICQGHWVTHVTLTRIAMGFSTTKSGPQFHVSSEGWCF